MQHRLTSPNAHCTCRCVRYANTINSTPTHTSILYSASKPKHFRAFSIFLRSLKTETWQRFVNRTQLCLPKSRPREMHPMQISRLFLYLNIFNLENFNKFKTLCCFLSLEERAFGLGRSIYASIFTRISQSICSLHIYKSNLFISQTV